MKELINQFHSLFDNFQKEKDEVRENIAFSERTTYLQDQHRVKNNEMIRIEIGQRRHIANIIDIERKGYQGLTPWGYSALETDILRSKKSLYFVVYHKLTPIAFLGSRLEDNNIHITNIAVVPDWQSQGIGRLLIEKLIEVAKVEQVASLSLEVRVSNEKAKILYDRMGFESLRVKKNYYHGDGEDALDMHLIVREDLKTLDEKEE